MKTAKQDTDRCDTVMSRLTKKCNGLLELELSRRQDFNKAAGAVARPDYVVYACLVPVLTVLQKVQEATQTREKRP